LTVGLRLTGGFGDFKITLAN